MAKTDLTTTQEFIQKHIIEELPDVVERHPYFAFCLMGIVIEVFGKLITPGRSLGDTGTSEADFKYAIDNLEGFKDYRNIPLNLYVSLRCALVHRVIPGPDIELSPDGDEPTKREFGAKQMFERIKVAWAEVLLNAEAHSKLQKKGAVIAEGITGGTGTNLATLACKGKL